MQSKNDILNKICIACVKMWKRNDFEKGFTQIIFTLNLTEQTRYSATSKTEKQKLFTNLSYSKGCSIQTLTYEMQWTSADQFQ